MNPAFSAAVFALFALILGSCNGERVSRVSIGGPTMGTSWSVILADGLSTGRAEQLQSSIETELSRINQLMSTYDPTSELSVFNKSSSTAATALHADTLKVLKAAIAISRHTNGAYDVTIGPVIDLWGFGANESEPRPPDQRMIDKALLLSGFSHLHINEQTVAKQIPGLRIDLSSIAKGFAVDQIGALVERAGIENFTAEIGGEILTRGNSAVGQPWRIGIEVPNTSSNNANFETNVVHGIAVTDSHIASSGDYRNFREVNGVRYAHIIDGTTGRPVKHSVAAVTVLHQSTMLADGWATALMILPMEKSVELAKRMGIEAQFTYRTDTGFDVVRTDGFPAIVE